MGKGISKMRIVAKYHEAILKFRRDCQVSTERSFDRLRLRVEDWIRFSFWLMYVVGISRHVSRLTVGTRFECHAQSNVLKAVSCYFGVIAVIILDGELKWLASNRESVNSQMRPT